MTTFLHMFDTEQRNAQYNEDINTRHCTIHHILYINATRLQFFSNITLLNFLSRQITSLYAAF